MNNSKLRVIVLSVGGAELVLKQLSALPSIDIAGIIVEIAARPNRTLREKIKRSIRYDGYWATAKKFLKVSSSRSAETQTHDTVSLERLSHELKIPYFTVTNYHDPKSIELLNSLNADLAIVFGTNILKKSVFGLPRKGAINFHSGLVPFYRGGPPVFWELFNNESELGLTVHWMAEKVDTGDVIVQERVPLKYDFAFGVNFETFIDEYRRQLGERCARLVAIAVELIASEQTPSIAQDLSLGNRYRLPTKKQKDELRRRLRKRRAEQSKQMTDIVQQAE
jgi:methionyl-tRNA formyltransferase